MFWLDYTVQSGPNCFTVTGDWPGEVMGWDRDGNKDGGLKSRPLYQPQDVFQVDDTGWLRKLDAEPGDVFMLTRSGKLQKIAQQSED